MKKNLIHLLILPILLLVSCINQDSDKKVEKNEKVESDIPRESMSNVDLVIVKISGNITSNLDKFRNPLEYNSVLVNVVQYPKYYGLINLSNDVYHNSRIGDTLFVPLINMNNFFRMEPYRDFPIKRELNISDYSTIVE